MDVELLQFRFSNYNEKVRWALDYKTIAHRRRDLLPGPHRGAVKKLTGETATPVLRIDGDCVAGSAAIIDELEQRFPGTRHLYPEDPEIRAQALEHQRHFDWVLGPAVRTCVFAAVHDDARYVARLFAEGARPATRALYRALLPLWRAPMQRANGIRHVYATRLARRYVNETASMLARLSKRSFYLCGDSFSVADLAAAALLAPLVLPPHPDMKVPEPMPIALAALTDEWRAHPVGEWVLELYRRHRPPSASA